MWYENVISKPIYHIFQRALLNIRESWSLMKNMSRQRSSSTVLVACCRCSESQWKWSNSWLIHHPFSYSCICVAFSMFSPLTILTVADDGSEQRYIKTERTGKYSGIFFSSKFWKTKYSTLCKISCRHLEYGSGFYTPWRYD